MGLFKIDYHIYEDETLNIVIGIQMWPGNHDKSDSSDLVAVGANSLLLPSCFC